MNQGRRKRSRGARAVLAAALALAACGGGEVVTQLDAEQLYRRGMTAFQEEDWGDAIRYLDRLSFVAPTHPDIGLIRYRLAEAHYRKKEYITAATEFGRLANELAADTIADEARWGVCRSYRELSPDPQLDQEYTYSAIDHCEALVQLYPNSPYADDARQVVEKMRGKLARKIYEGGEWYFRRNGYDSAIIYYEDVLQNFPDTPSAPASLLRLYEIFEILGYEEEMQEARDRLLSQYPESDEARALRSGAAAARGQGRGGASGGDI